MHSLEIVQWDSTRRDQPGYPGGVSGSGPVNFALGQDLKSEYSSRATRGHQNKEFSSEIRAESSGGRGFRASGSLKSFVFSPRGWEPYYSSLFSI